MKRLLHSIQPFLSTLLNHKTALILIANLAAQDVMLIAPTLFTYECNSVIRLNVFRGTMTEAEATLSRTLLNALGVILEYDPNDDERAYQIATKYHQPRAYAAHAEARGVELITADAPLFDAVKGVKRPKTAPNLAFVKLLQ